MIIEKKKDKTLVEGDSIKNLNGVMHTILFVLKPGLYVIKNESSGSIYIDSLTKKGYKINL